MGKWLLPLFFFMPLVEMYILIRVGGEIGAWWTIGLVMLTAVVGVSLLRVQGLNTLTRGFSRLEGGSLPAQEVVEGLFLAVAGALLLTPGFVTDTIGFLLLAPPSRAWLAVRVLRNVQIVTPGSSGPAGGFGPGGFGPGGVNVGKPPPEGERPGAGPFDQFPSGGADPGETIEGEFRRK